MSRGCEVCQGSTAESVARPARGRVRRVMVEERIVVLCDAHAAQYRASGASTLAELREVFNEPAGRRSLVVRRAPLVRRAFPPRPEGRRRAGGRRATDHE